MYYVSQSVWSAKENFKRISKEKKSSDAEASILYLAQQILRKQNTALGLLSKIYMLR